MDRIFQDRGFCIHLAIYAAVNLLLLVINLATNSNKLWFYWPLMGWGLGIIGHAYLVYRKRSASVPMSGTTQRAVTPEPPPGTP
ncbi:2TM domain-containing protein [Hyphomicrobium denitrificans]|nr:2TM domain-containing protein [Hyphomicrobium denitrificans]